MKNAPSQAMGLKMIREGKKPGQQPGPKPGRPGRNAMAQGPPPSKPNDPKKPPAPVALDKSIWGNLPPSFREQMGNAMSEIPAAHQERADPSSTYLSLGKKTANPEE